MANSLFLHAKITGISSMVPENFINIDDEISLFNNDQALLDRNKKILGLNKRHIADKYTTNADLCEAAAKKLLNALDCDKDTIDSLIVVSTSHDYHYPASACILQDRLNLLETCACLDVSGLACSGYAHGLWLAHSLIESGASRKCLLLAGDLASTHSSKENRYSNPLFGDAGTATLLEYTKHENPEWFILGTRGSGWDNLIAPAGGYNLPIREDIANLAIRDKTGNVWRLYDDIMDGMKIFKFSTEIAPKGITEILNFAQKNMEQIDYFAFHQANKQIIRSVANFAGLPKDKYSWTTFSQFGNCATAAVTLDICRQMSCQNLSYVCLVTFGVGLSWGIAIVNLQGTITTGIDFYKTPLNKTSREQKIAYWIAKYKESTHAKE